MVPRMLAFLFLFSMKYVAEAQVVESGDGSATPIAPPPAAERCNGIFLSYEFESREKEYPRLKNVSAQGWAFKSTATILNAGLFELKAWKMFIGFQHREILVSAENAVLVDGDDFPVAVGDNGAYLSGSPQPDLKTSMDTAGDLTQISAQVKLKGTQFGVKPPGVPMPKTINLVNDGYKCPAPTHKKSSMYLCCVKDPKFKVKTKKTKYFPRQNGDLLLSYDVMQAYESSYLAQVTIQNKNPLGRLDHWNLTWEWMTGEFIYSMKGAFTHLRDYSGCIYGTAALYYKELDFSQVMNCEKKPIIADLPPDRENDEKIGKLPFCCRNGTLLPTTMNETKSKAVFQMQVFKVPPYMNRTSFFPPEKWKINGFHNPHYKCGSPLRVEDSLFPDPSGLQAISPAVASWQVVCNISSPKAKESRCCVSFSAYYNDSVIPCESCACGCDDDDKCNQKAPALLLPPEALLVPFKNRTLKALHWAKLQHLHIPSLKRLPCPDNCGVSINWHVNTNYRGGWTARITLFNWEQINFQDWSVAVQLKKAGPGFDKVYSFNGTIFKDLNNTIFLQGLPGLNFLMGIVNGTNPAKDPMVPGKQQSIISFTRKGTHGLDIIKGDGFPSRLYFNGEECALPKTFPTSDGTRCNVNLVSIVCLIFVSFLLTTNCHT